MKSKVRRSPLFVLTAERIRELILAGTWSESLPGERTLAEELGVSRPVLRKALVELDREGWVAISQGKATRIRKKTSSKNSAQRNAARSVRLLSPLPIREMPPLVVCWIDELRERLGGAGYDFDLLVQPSLFRARSPRVAENELASHPETIWILYRGNEFLQRWFAANGLPCLVAGSTSPEIGLSSVDLDHRAVCRHAVGTLLGRGRQKPALVIPDSGAIGDHESEAGFAEAFETRPEQERVILRHDGSVESIVRKVERACREGGVDGLIVARSAHALTVLTALQRRGIRVPEDVALISRDDDAFLTSTVPEVARYTSDPRRWAKEITKGIDAFAMQAGAMPRTVRLMPRFEPGQSLD